MLYKFKSKAAGDVIMLQANGDQILQLIGKQPAPQGIILPEHMPAAITALEQAIAGGLAAQTTALDDKQDDTPPADRINLRQRATPFIDMLKRCHKEGKEIVWGT